MKEMQKEIKDMPVPHSQVGLHRQDQYYGRNCWLIYRVPKNRNENIDQVVIETLKEKMGENAQIRRSAG